MNFNENTNDLSEHILKLTNRYLFQKARISGFLKDSELLYLRSMMALNPRLSQNVLYFARHSVDEQSVKDQFLQDFYKYFIIDDRSYKVFGKNQAAYMRLISGKPYKNVQFNSEYSAVNYKDAGYGNYWRLCGRTQFGWEFNGHEGRQNRFFVPTIIKNDFDNTVKSLGIQIDKEKLKSVFDDKKVWGVSYKGTPEYDIRSKWGTPNYMMCKPLINSAYYKLNDTSDPKAITNRIMQPIDYSDVDSFNEQQTLQIVQPERIQNVQLKFYQSSNVGWMTLVEKQLEGHGVAYSQTIEISKGIFVDIADQSFHKKSKGTKMLIPKGGGLFDEVGLGKTLCMITLAASNPREMVEIPQSIRDKIKAAKSVAKKTTTTSKTDDVVVCEAKIKSGKRKGEECGNAVKKPAAKSKSPYTFEQLKLYRCCLRHAVEIIGNAKNPNKVPIKKAKTETNKTTTPLDKTVNPSSTPSKSLDVEDIAFEVPKTDDRYNSRATLVICPNQIPYQWKSQVEQYTNPKMKVVMLCTVVESKTFTYLDVIDADFVITTFNALERAVWDSEGTGPTVSKKLPPLSTRIPHLKHFHFHRIVVDEAHEIIDTKFRKMLPKLFDLKTTYKWCVTGTPFKNPKLNYDLMITWLYDGAYSSDETERIYGLIQSHYPTFEKLFRRNTKQSVQNVVPVSDRTSIEGGHNAFDDDSSMLAEQKLWQSTSDEVVWLSLSDIERSMYNARLMTLGTWVKPETDEYLKQICCSPTLNNENANLMNDLNYSARTGKADANEIKKALVQKTQNLIDDMHNNEIPERIVKVWNNLSTFKEDVDDKKSRMVYYTSIHHLKRTFFRLFQLRKSKREFSSTSTSSNSYYYGYRSRPDKILELFQCSGCKKPVTITETYDHTKQTYEVNNQKTDSRFGVSECGHFFCGKCAFDSFKYKLQLDEVKIKQKPVKKKRKTDEPEKMGSCVYGFGLCNNPDCQVVETIKDDDGTIVQSISKPKKVKMIGLPNALTIQANNSVESEGDDKKRKREDEEGEEGSDHDADREVSPAHEHKFKRVKGGSNIPDYVTGVFKEEYECNVNLYGTKVTNLVAYLKTYTNYPHNQRIILFSQYDKFLESVKNTLTQFGLACVSCKGNVFSKKKATSHFKDDPKYRIILLSSKFSASGLDLIEANKVIFLDPVYGDHKAVKAIETQAIGRAHRLGQKHPVKVVRFLIRDTIEEGAYKEYQKLCSN